MADFKIEFYEDEKDILEKQLKKVHAWLNDKTNSSGISTSNLLYSKMLIEKKLKLLERIKYFPTYMYKSCLLNTDIVTYRSFIKSTYINEIAFLKHEMQQDIKLLNQYRQELDNVPSEARQQELLLLIGSIMSRDEQDQDRLDELNTLSMNLNSKGHEEFSLDIINEGYNHNVNDLMSDYSISSKTSTEEAIYQMMQEKDKNDRLQSILRSVKSANLEKKNLMLSINLSSLSFHTLDLLKDKFGFVSSKISVNYDKLQELQKYFDDLARYLNTEGFAVLKNLDPEIIKKINSSDKKSFVDYYNYFNKLKMVIDLDELGYFNELFKNYEHINSKPFKTISDRNKIKDITSELINLIDTIIKEINEKSLSYYDYLIDKLHMEQYDHPASIRSLNNKYNDISERYKFLLNDINTLNAIINKGLGIFENKIDNSNSKINLAAQEIKEETGITVDPVELSSISSIDLFDIFKKVFLIDEMNKMCTKIEDSVTSDIKSSQELKKLPY